MLAFPAWPFEEIPGVFLDILKHRREVMKKILGFLEDEAGVTSIEYGLIAALVSLVIITAVTAIGANLTTVFNKISLAIH